MLLPGLGLLQDDFPDPALKIWTVGPDERAELRPGVRVPTELFLGEMGDAPEEPGAHATMPPRRTGGNLDTRHIIKGSVTYFPVQVPGALFSIGDGHLAQGDGEVCGTAIEAPLTVTVKISLRKGRSIPGVQFVTNGPTTSKSDGMGYYVTTAEGPDLQVGAERSVRYMIDHLESEHGLSRTDAYMLCSVAGDLKISVPVLGESHTSLVAFYMPHSVFIG